MIKWSWIFWIVVLVMLVVAANHFGAFAALQNAWQQNEGALDPNRQNAAEPTATEEVAPAEPTDAPAVDVPLPHNGTPQPQPTAAEPTAAITPTVQFTSTSTLWEENGYKPQEPKACGDKPGMCPLAIDINAYGCTTNSGAPMGYEGENRMYNSGKGEGQVWMFCNSSDKDVSVVMTGWSGANGVMRYDVSGDMETAQAEILSKDMRVLHDVGCTDTGCYSAVGYTVWVCDNNQSCSLQYSFNPVQDPQDNRHHPKHEDILKGAGISEK